MTHSAADFRLRHALSQGVNFCFYLVGKGQLRLPALARSVLWLAPDRDPFADFARRFEIADAGGLEPLAVEPLWRSWLGAVVEGAPDSAADALSAMPELPARPEVRTAFQRFARVQLNEFVERWTGVRLEMEGLLGSALRSFDAARILARHEQALGVEYGGGRAAFHYHLLRVFSVSRFGACCVLGAAHLERPDRLVDVVAHETLHMLVGQTQVWQREEIRALLEQLRPVLAQTYLEPADAVEEALCILVSVLEHEGEAAPLERVEGRVAQAPLRLVARAFYEHRRTRYAQGFAQWVGAALQHVARMRRAA